MNTIGCTVTTLQMKVLVAMILEGAFDVVVLLLAERPSRERVPLVVLLLPLGALMYGP